MVTAGMPHLLPAVFSSLPGYVTVDSGFAGLARGAVGVRLRTGSDVLQRAHLKRNADAPFLPAFFPTPHGWRTPAGFMAFGGGRQP